MIKISTDAKINGLHLYSLEYKPTGSFSQTLRAQIALVNSYPNNVLALGEHTNWSEATIELFKNLLTSMEQDCVQTYFGKSDLEEQEDDFELPSEKVGLSIPEDRMHGEYGVGQF